MRLINLNRVLILLYAVILGLLLAYGPQLRWASSAVPELFDGSIGAPLERQLYRQARKLIRDGNASEDALRLLERSLEIDPTCEAGYWLAEYHFVRREYIQALDAFERYIAIDPTVEKAYTKVATIHERAGRLTEALDALDRGRRYFEENASDYRPHLYDDVREKYNDKAVRVYKRYLRYATRLAEEHARVQAKLGS